MRTISLIKENTFPPEFYPAYSKFKYGSKTQARFFGKEVASICDFSNHKNLVFYAAPSHNIPTASHSFRDYLLNFCSRSFMESGNTVRQGKINRQYSYDEEYSLMSAEQRLSKISDDMLYIDKNFISPEDVLVFVDDIKITGSHEKHIVDLLQRQEIKNEAIFVYIAEYTGDDPTIEYRLNRAVVNCLKDINDIIRNEEFIFNTRVVKFILNSDIEHFVSFITYQSNTFRETLFSLSILNNYHINPKYKTNFDILKNTL